MTGKLKALDTTVGGMKGTIMTIQEGNILTDLVFLVRPEYNK